MRMQNFLKAVSLVILVQRFIGVGENACWQPRMQFSGDALHRLET